MKPRVRIFRFVMYFLLMALVALISTVITMRLAIHGREVTIPDVGGQTIAEARQRAQANHLAVEIDGRYFSDSAPAGRVLTQLPAAGTVVRRGWRIRVSESLGPRRVPIPDVVGEPERVSSIRIRRLGLELGSVARLPYPSQQSDVVIAQEPPANGSDASRSHISILIADQPAPDSVAYVMPDFVGQMLSTAEAAVQRAGLRVAPQPQPQATSAAISAPAPVAQASPGPAAGLPTPAAQVPQHPPVEGIPGSITGQSPPAGSRVDATTLIHFTVIQ